MSRIGDSPEYPEAHQLLGVNRADDCAVCKIGQEGFMIACDHCNRWFHGRCLIISKEYIETIKVFFCLECLAKDKSLKVVFHPRKKPNSVTGKPPSCMETRNEPLLPCVDSETAASSARPAFTTARPSPVFHTVHPDLLRCVKEKRFSLSNTGTDQQRPRKSSSRTDRKESRRSEPYGTGKDKTVYHKLSKSCYDELSCPETRQSSAYELGMSCDAAVESLTRLFKVSDSSEKLPLKLDSLFSKSEVGKLSVKEETTYEIIADGNCKREPSAWT